MRFRNLASVVLLLSGVVGGAWGQTPPPRATEKERVIDLSSDLGTIRKKAQEQTAKLGNNADAAGQRAGREALLDAMGAKNLPPGAIDGYAKVLNDELMALLKDQTPANLRARINAGIVAARVAEKAQSAALTDVAEALLNDPEESVVLWGMRTARGVLPASLRNAAQNNKLAAAVEAAMLKHPSGMTAQEAYVAMSLGLFDSSAAQKPTSAMLAAALPVMQRMLEARLKVYANHLPSDPIAEKEAALFLPDQRVWDAPSGPTAQADAMKVKSVQLLSDLLGLSAQHLAAASQRQDDLMQVFTVTADALIVIGRRPGVNNAAVQSAAQPLRGLHNPPAAIVADAAKVYTALKSTPLFANLTPPPTVDPAAATTAPAMTATSAPAAMPGAGH